MGRGQGRPQRLYSGVERRPAISMKSKKKFMILWVLLIAVLFAGSLLTAPPGKAETIQTAMRDAVLHEDNKISLFGLMDVNPAVVSGFIVTGVLLVIGSSVTSLGNAYGVILWLHDLGFLLIAVFGLAHIFLGAGIFQPYRGTHRLMFGDGTVSEADALYHWGHWARKELESGQKVIRK